MMPGGHVFSKMQDRHVYLQDWHKGGDPKREDRKQNARRLKTHQKVPQESGVEEELQGPKTNSPAHPGSHPLPESKTGIVCTPN